MTRPSARLWVALILAWIAVFAAAVWADAPVATWARSSGTATVVRTASWAEWLKFPGTFWFTAIVLGLLWAARRIHWRQLLFALAVAAFAGLNGLPKWIVGRTRPFKLQIPMADQPRPLELHPFWHGAYGLFHETNLSFPSGHECTAFALTAALLVVYRPAGWVIAVLAAAVGVERVLENAHYASDVVGAVGFASLGAWAIWSVMGSWVKGREAPQPIPVLEIA